MNLYTLGNGLFGTHVTWEDIEEDMQRELDTLAIFGPNKTVKNVGDGRGFMSKIALIQPDWQYKDKDLPENFVVKIVSQLSMIEITEEMSSKKNTKNIFDSEQMRMAIEQQQKRIHNTEVTVYKHLMKHPGRVPITKIYYMKKFSKYNPVKGYIIMEYVENIKPLHIYENVPPKSLKKVLRAKAALEAISLNFTEDEKNEFTHRPFAELFGPIFTKETVETMIDGMRGFGTEETTKKLEKMKEVLMEFMNFEWADQLADELGMQRVLCHGDLWSTNMLWKENGNDVNMAAMIDFQATKNRLLVLLSKTEIQTAHMGCPANDLIRLFSACLSGKDRQEHWEQLVEEFYGYLEEEVGDKPMPYTLEQLKEACRKFMPLGTFMIVTTIAPMYEALYHNPDERQKKRSMDLVTEKTECLLDDLLKYHERNMLTKNGNSV
ncbi:unnamed protein product [Cylicocyclus nassatus]|uniref:CHK kinase-like domain-containing protein n=1 Tax=Cylicocyclus nassatus TaxID=53992 RepID=A0AA36DL71_CYLNA|nr:unnamed protein product [Cylicocyclus nassatus]